MLCRTDLFQIVNTEIGVAEVLLFWICYCRLSLSEN